MNDSAGPSPEADKKTKSSWSKKILRLALALAVMAVFAVGLSSYYLSYPFAWPSSIWPSQENPLEARLRSLERTIESEVLGDPMSERMDARIERSLEQALAAFAAKQSQARSEQDAEHQAVSADIERLQLVLDEVTANLSEAQGANPSLALRLAALDEEVSDLGRSLANLNRRLDERSAGMVPNASGPVTEASVREFMANRGELLEAYWALLEIEGHLKQHDIGKPSKDLALTGYDGLATKWQRSDNEDLKRLLPLLAQEQAAVASWSPVEWTQWQTQSQEWLGNYKSWSFSQPSTDLVAPAEAEADRTLADAREAGDGWMSRVTDLFTALVQVRPRNLAALSNRDQRLAQANIEQRLLLLQVALASQDVEMTRSQAAQLSIEIERLFRPDETQNVINQLQRLTEIEGSPPPSSLGGVKEAIEQVLYQP